MARRTALPLALLVILGYTAPAAAQDYDPFDDNDHVWTADRPDGHAPAGVDHDIALRAGSYLFSYRYSYVSLDQLLVGEDTISPDRAIGDLAFLSAPFAGNVRRHELGVEYGLTDRLTFSARVPYVQKRTEALTGTTLFLTESEGFGDVEVGGLFRFLDEGPYRAHAHLGLSLPTGSVKKAASTPLSAPARTPLPFVMQTGSGTWDLEPGLTLLIQNPTASVGGQLSGTIRLGENDLDYTLGNGIHARAWGAYVFTPRISGSIGLDWEAWDEVDGFDARTDPTVDPGFDPRLQGGSRVSVPFGFNLLFHDGVLAGHRFVAEANIPVHEDLDGPQLSRDWSLSLGWEKTY